MRHNVAVIMAGGRGTRLHPHTLDTPKPMLMVAGRPIIERIVLHLMGCGLRTFFIAVNYLAEQIEEYLGDGTGLGCTVHYLREEADHPLGTAGALRLLPNSVQASREPIIMLNGDVVCNVDVDAMLRFHDARNSAVTVGIHQYTHQIPFGVVHGADGAVSGLAEKPTIAFDVNAGIYAVDPRLIDEIPANTAYSATDLITSRLLAGDVVSAFHIDEEWQDVGTPNDLAIARGLQVIVG
jgi:NDP-sugar pyrophosphorylase family protein